MITPKSVASLIFNAAIDTFNVAPATTNSSRAEVTFTTGEGCLAYYNSTPNGLCVKLGSEIITVMVDLHTEVSPVSSQLQELLGKGATRCVRAVGVDKEWNLLGLGRVAEGTKRQLRRLEHIVDEINIAGVCGSFQVLSISLLTDILTCRSPVSRSDLPIHEHCGCCSV